MMNNLFHLIVKCNQFICIWVQRKTILKFTIGTTAVRCIKYNKKKNLKLNYFRVVFLYVYAYKNSVIENGFLLTADGGAPKL